MTTWKPSRGTVVYEAFTVTPTSTGAKVRLADTRRLDARGGWRGGSPGPCGDHGHPAGLRGRAVAHRQPGERAGGADLVLRPELRPLQPLLLRPDRAGAAARPRVHPARRADGHEPGPWPARRPGSSAGRDQPVRAPVAHRPRPLGGGHRERRRRGPTLARVSCRPHRTSFRAPWTSWPGPCARSPGSTASGSLSPARPCHCRVVASTPP